MRAAGFETREAYDGQQALSWASKHQPDAIVVDVRMPVMDGLTTLNRLKDKDDTKNIPIVMLSASVVDEQAALDAGACYFIRKPFQSDTLVTAVRAATSKMTNTRARTDERHS